MVCAHTIRCSAVVLSPFLKSSHALHPPAAKNGPGLQISVSVRLGTQGWARQTYPAKDHVFAPPPNLLTLVVFEGFQSLHG